MKILDHHLIAQLSSEAKKTPAKKLHYPLLSNEHSLLYRALISIEPGAYFHPHKHNSTVISELLVLIQGECLLVTFNDDGSISEGIRLSTNNGIIGMDVNPQSFHTLLPLKVSTVILEVKEYSSSPTKEDKIVASWAPTPDDHATIKTWHERLLQHFNIVFPEIY